MFLFVDNDVAFYEIHIDVGDHHTTIALSMQTVWKPDTTSLKSSSKNFIRHPSQIFLCRAVRRITSDSVCIVMLYTVYLVYVTCRNTWRRIDTALALKSTDNTKYIHVHAVPFIHTYTHTRTRTRTNKTRACTHTHAHTRARARAPAHAHTHIHAHTHKHTYTQAHLCGVEGALRCISKHQKLVTHAHYAFPVIVCVEKCVEPVACE